MPAWSRSESQNALHMDLMLLDTTPKSSLPSSLPPAAMLGLCFRPSPKGTSASGPSFHPPHYDNPMPGSFAGDNNSTGKFLMFPKPEYPWILVFLMQSEAEYTLGWHLGLTSWKREQRALHGSRTSIPFPHKVSR